MNTIIPARLRPTHAAALAALLALAATPAWSKGAPPPIDTWICGSGAWTTGACWSSPAPYTASGYVHEKPWTNTRALLTTNLFHPGNVVVGYDLANPPYLWEVLADGTPFGTVTLNQTGGVLNSHQVYVGVDGTAAYTQSAGANRVYSTSFWQYGPGKLVLGDHAAGNGSYTLSGSGILEADTETVGSAGRGSFVQSGGSHTVRGNLVIGAQAGSHGSVTLSGNGALNAGALVVGQQGSGTFTQHGGVSKVGGNLEIGTGGGSGSVVLDGGALSVNGNIQIGAPGQGSASLLVDNVVLTNGDGRTLKNAGGLHVKSAGAIDNQGTLVNVAAGLVSVLGKLDNHGMLDNEAGAHLVNEGRLLNDGVFTSAGSVQGRGSFTQLAGWSHIDGRFAQDSLSIQGGDFFGGGVVTTDSFDNAGGVVAGGDEVDAGTLSIEGRYSQGEAATLMTLIDGSAAGQFSVLAVRGDANLQGTLEIETADDFSFAAGQSFQVLSLSRGALSGSFSTLRYGALTSHGGRLALGDDLQLALRYGSAGVELVVSSMPRPPVVAAVPEPSSWALLGAGGVLLAWRRRRVA